MTGRVQGVFFRAWTRDQARELGVNGWVRNCADGSVEAHLEGDEPAVEALIERMRNGPRAACVAELTEHEAQPEGSGPFKISCG